MTTKTQDEQLTTKQVAALTGLAVSSVREFRRRGTFPEPDGYLEATPWWRRRTIERWLAARPPVGRPRKEKSA